MQTARPRASSTTRRIITCATGPCIGGMTAASLNAYVQHMGPAIPTRTNFPTGMPPIKAGRKCMGAVDAALGDLLTALTVLPWLIPLGFFTFIFIEQSGRGRGEANLYARLLGEWQEYARSTAGRIDRSRGGMPGRSQEDALRRLLDGEEG
jgi:hypothetical protein